MATQRKKERFSRFFRTALALVCLCALLLPVMTPAAEAKVTQADIDALSKDADKLADEKKELESKLKELAGDKSAALQRKKLLDQKVNNISAEISNTESKISGYATLITQTEEELTEAEQQEAEQYELFCQRVRAMEERGTISYWSVLFKSSSFTDMLSRLDFINEIMDSDQSIIDRLQALQVEIEEKKTGLETNKAAAEDAKAVLVSQKSELDVQRKEANALMQEIEDNQNEYKDTLSELEAEEDAIQKKIVQLSKELAAQNSQGTAALGGYIWPVSSHRITSPFGTRMHPIYKREIKHNGVDIGGVGYSSSIYAAKAGTVIVSQYSSSYGNYVVVSHGSGNTTLYAHMSSRKVSVNDVVKQGQVIGITGSTGNSTGPHLHFEITENGVRVDPLKYLTDYTKAWS